MRVRLIAAGWHPKRNVWNRLTLPKLFEVHDEARRVLVEYGALKFGDRNDSVTLDPSRGDEIAHAAKELQNNVKAHLYPLGVMEHQDSHYLLIDEQGVLYTLIEAPGENIIVFELEPFASTFEKALSFFLRPVSNESDLKSIGLFGKVWRVETKPGVHKRESRGHHT